MQGHVIGSTDSFRVRVGKNLRNLTNLRSVESNFGGRGARLERDGF